MIQAKIEERLQATTLAVLPDAETERIFVRPCNDPAHGDYQSNALMGLAKQRHMNPRQLAEDIVSKLNVSDWCEPVEIAVETADQAALVRAEEADYFAFLNSDEFTPAKLKRRLASHDEYVQQPQRRPEP